MQGADYGRWMSYARVSEDELAAMGRQAAGFAYLPRVSLLLVVSDDDEVWIKNSLNSVLRQVYPLLELCVCDNGSERPHVPEVLEDYAAGEERIKAVHLPGKGSRATAYGAALSAATGEFVALVDVGDELAPEALFEVVESLQRVPADVVYTDEDRIDVVGERSDPVFKPYWSPDLLLSAPYIGRLCAVRRRVVEEAGGFRDGFDGAEERDLLLRVSERTDRIRHLPGVLYHRWVPSWQTVSQGAGDEASVRAVGEALVRRGEDAEVRPDGTGGSLRVRRRLSGRPEVSVILSVPEGADGAPFVDEMERKTSYPARQLILAGGGEGDYPTAAGHVSHPFPARAMNLAAEEANGEYLVFTGGCTRVRPPGWLPELLGHARRRGVGVVGCKLLDPDGGLRHGGSFVDLSKLVGYAGEYVFGGEELPVVADRTFNPAAASAGCMAVRRDVFEAVGGFDDENLPTAFYDLDLSFRLREMGLRNVYTPYVSLICDGLEGSMPGESEVAYMWRRWWGELVRLLYYARSPLLRPTRRGVDEEALLDAIPS